MNEQGNEAKTPEQTTQDLGKLAQDIGALKEQFNKQAVDIQKAYEEAANPTPIMDIIRDNCTAGLSWGIGYGVGLLVVFGVYKGICALAGGSDDASTTISTEG